MNDFALQASYRLMSVPGEPLVNVRGDTVGEFREHLKEIQGLAELIQETGAALAPVTTTAQAVQTIQQAMPGSKPIHFLNGPQGNGGDNDREAELRGKGFIPDKWHSGPGQGGWWHPKVFDEAPSCQCGGAQNRSKLALKVGNSKSGKEYTGWFCANTFGQSAKAGCSAVFSGNFPEV